MAAATGAIDTKSDPSSLLLLSAAAPTRTAPAAAGGDDEVLLSRDLAEDALRRGRAGVEGADGGGAGEKEGTQPPSSSPPNSKSLPLPPSSAGAGSGAGRCGRGRNGMPAFAPPSPPTAHPTRLLGVGGGDGEVGKVEVSVESTGSPLLIASLPFPPHGRASAFEGVNSTDGAGPNSDIFVDECSEGSSEGTPD